MRWFRKRESDQPSRFRVYGFWRPEPHVPPAFWRSLTPARQIFACTALLLIGWALLGYLLTFGGTKSISLGWWLLLLPVGAVLLAWTPYYRFAKKRFYEKVWHAEFRVCWDCGYLMHGLPNGHPCPECGRVYGEQLDTTAWKRWMELTDQNEQLNLYRDNSPRL